MSERIVPVTGERKYYAPCAIATTPTPLPTTIIFHLKHARFEHRHDHDDEEGDNGNDATFLNASHMDVCCAFAFVQSERSGWRSHG